MEKQIIPLFLSPMNWLIWLVVLIVLITLYGMYTRLIQKKNNVAEAFSDIDVQLKKRYDLIPNILTIANKFMEHERSLFEKITELRTQAVNIPNDINQADKKFQLDTQISSMMGQLKVQVENYPQLKSDQTMIQAMQTYNTQEEHIAAARNFYNSAVKELNNAVEIFPSSLVAAIIGIKSATFIQATAEERQRIDAADYLK